VLRHDLPAARQGDLVKCKTVKHWIALCDADKLPSRHRHPRPAVYEAWIGGESHDYAWPEFDERSAAALCYTSGTTGNPKGALYSHRSTVLHAYGGALPDALNVSARDSDPAGGADVPRQRLGHPVRRRDDRRQAGVPRPGARRQVGLRADRGRGRHLRAGVPTVWLGLLNHMAQAA
jgi:3-(methylthio)propionyl---CoA ligase